MAGHLGRVRLLLGPGLALVPVPDTGGGRVPPLSSLERGAAVPPDMTGGLDVEEGVILRKPVGPHALTGTVQAR